MLAAYACIDIDGGRLDARYIDWEGTELDRFTILKGAGARGAGGGGGAGGAGGAVAVGGSGGTGGSGAADAAPRDATASDDGGCGCRTSPGEATGPRLAALVVAGLVVARRRRIARPPLTRLRNARRTQ